MTRAVFADDSFGRNREYALKSRRPDLPCLRRRIMALGPLVLWVTEPLDPFRGRRYVDFDPLTIEVAQLWVATLASLPVFLVLYFGTWLAIGQRRVRTAVTLAVVMA